MKHLGKKVEPTKILTFAAQDSIKKAAELSNNDFFLKVKDEDLIAREFKYHRHCFRNFTRTNTTPTEEEPVKPKGDYDAVRSCVDEDIIESGQILSMRYLHSIYGVGYGDSRYTGKLKQKLFDDYGDKLKFLPCTGRKETEIVIGTVNIDKFIAFSDRKTLENAAKILSSDIRSKFSESSELSWPPSSEQLQKNDQKPPESIYIFLTSLFKDFNKGSYLTHIQERMVESIASDIVYGSTSGKFIQLKHFLSAVGLHDLTGSRKVVDIVHGLGHCLSYNLTMDIKTGVAEQVLQKIKDTEILPLQPLTEDGSVPTSFWVDNFDINIDSLLGGGAINNTHLMAFQEKTDQATFVENNTPVERRKSRKIFIDEVPRLTIDSNTEPPKINGTFEFEVTNNEFNLVYFLWAYLRNAFSYHQQLLSFKGFTLKLRDAANENPPIKTVETFLPPINAKVNDFSTIQRYMIYLQRLAESVNMAYVNITLDVGAAINAFKMVWNHPEVFKNVVIHLGGFHFLKENFQVSKYSLIKKLSFC